MPTYNNKNYLIIVDVYSNYPDIYEIPTQCSGTKLGNIILIDLMLRKNYSSIIAHAFHQLNTNNLELNGIL